MWLVGTIWDDAGMRHGCCQREINEAELPKLFSLKMWGVGVGDGVELEDKVSHINWIFKSGLKYYWSIIIGKLPREGEGKRAPSQFLPVNATLWLINNIIGHWDPRK